MNLFKLLPVIAVAGVLMAATAAIATVQGIEDAHNYAAEGEQAAQACPDIEVEYGQNAGDIDRVKMSYPAGIGDHDGNFCGGNVVNVEVHNAAHEVLGSCAPIALEADGSTQCDISPVIPHGLDPGNGGVVDVDHVNIVLTDLE